MTGPRELEQEAFDTARDRIAEQEFKDLAEGFGEDGPDMTIDVRKAPTIDVSTPGHHPRTDNGTDIREAAP